MKNITKTDIETLVNEIKMLLHKHSLELDVSIYANDKRHCYNFDTNTWKIETNINPHIYLEYCAYNHILSMSFEGPLYRVFNGYSGIKTTVDFLNSFNNLLDKYETYYELGDAWNLTLFPSNEHTNFEFTCYNKPKEPKGIYLWNLSDYDIKIQNIFNAWHELAAKEKDLGSCVIGAGFSFTWEGENYWLPENSPWNGSLSWEKSKDVIQKMLENIGATNIKYDCGVLD